MWKLCRPLQNKYIPGNDDSLWPINGLQPCRIFSITSPHLEPINRCLTCCWSCSTVVKKKTTFCIPVLLSVSSCLFFQVMPYKVWILKFEKFLIKGRGHCVVYSVCLDVHNLQQSLGRGEILLGRFGCSFESPTGDGDGEGVSTHCNGQGEQRHLEWNLFPERSACGMSTVHLNATQNHTV